ncbi:MULTISPECIES: IS21 family transposase [Paenarthrobacter]|uniref:IS21 family transposase n=1 Tax=Paenarthrobacter TaxID=1742992 RepID=UPI00074D306B|nr:MULTISPECIES: IS21 family transposase [Paenarthrobacter]AMB40208.1 transposase [Arthrobacter sp. ATCC 21022]KUR63430.1 transposase [Arthrobacter sp. ATCC 21022]QOT15322.1 IS21 family transposase [Paenarthrobacter sp. YJN-5]RWW91373.1 IS21 family transposase [Paenarthrobacter ureafaciens]
MGSRVELFAQIRRDARVEGASIRELARRHQVARKTVRKALSSPVPPERKTPQRSSPRLDPFRSAIDAMLVEDTTAPRKQRHTARRILARLIEEHGAEELSYSTVRDYVRVRRAQIDVEAGRRVEVFVPQEHAPGAEAEVDFGEVWIVLDGVKTKCHMFIFRLSHSGKAIHRIYPTQAQEAFLEGHIEAFNEIGGVPVKHIRYDNLTSAVRSVVFGQGRNRLENDRWVLFRSFYGFDAFYCQPGIAGAHEKGGVEGEVGWFRRNRLTPMPVTRSLEDLNDRIRSREVQDDQRRIDGRIRTIGQDFAAEAPLLAPLPADEFDPGLVLNPRVDRSSMITVRMVKYSVPARFIGRRVRVSLRASEVVVFDGRAVAARHQRIIAKGGQSVQLDHYLEVLKTKPGALPGSTALARARESGAFTSAHEAFWSASRRVNGDAEGTRELIDVLLLHRSMEAEDIEAGITAALEVGAVSADVVAVEARRHASSIPAGGSRPDRHRGAHAEAKVQRVVSLTQRRLMDPAAVIAGLPPDKRPLPTISAYDELLAKRTEHSAGTTSKENIS